MNSTFSFIRVGYTKEMLIPYFVKRAALTFFFFFEMPKTYPCMLEIVLVKLQTTCNLTKIKLHHRVCLTLYIISVLL